MTMLKKIRTRLKKPMFCWTVTDGLKRIDRNPRFAEPSNTLFEVTDVLKHIKGVPEPHIYVLLDFHPYLETPCTSAC